MVLTAFSPLFGFTIFKTNPIETAATQMIINPLSTGAIGAAILFALFTLFELDRMSKYKVSALTDAIAPAMMLHIAKMAAVLSVSVVTGLLTILIYFPYTMIKMESFSDPSLYVSSYLIFMIPAMWFGSLFAAIFYQIFRRVDLSFILTTVCVLLGFNRGLLNWVIINIQVFSDGFGNAQPLRMGLYNRLFCFLFLTGAWSVSLLFTRRYEKSIFGSVMCNIKKWYLPVLGAVLLLLSINFYQKQPFYNKAPPEVNFDDVYIIQGYNIGLQVTSITAHVKPDFNKGTLFGEITYVLGEDSAYGKKGMIINSGYTLYSITADGKPIEFTDLANDTFTMKNILFDVPDGTTELKIGYGGYPMLWGQLKSSLGMGSSQISRRYVALRNNTLIPELFCRTSTEVSIVLPDNFTLLSLTLNEIVKEVIDNGDGTKTWTLVNPRDTIDILAADYAGRMVNAGSMSAEFYYHRNFHGLLEENGIDEVLADVFNFCTERFGPLYYLQDNRLKLIQTTASDFGGGALPGVSNMSETSFSIYSLTDPRKGAAGKEILAHEIIHQWWGLNRMIWGDDDYPAWTSEGLTVYSTYRLYKEKYGEEYGRLYYVDKWKQAVEEMNRNFYRRHPEYLNIMPENFAATIRVREEQVLRYSLMPLMIYRAAELVGGEEAMDEILSALSQSNNYEILTFQKFLDACGLTREALKIE
jgi:hypothetical protein